MNKNKLKYSELETGKLYQADCPYWFNAVFFRQDGRMMYRLDNGQVKATTYDMYPGLSNCLYVEYVEVIEEAKSLEKSKEPTFTFLDDRVDYLLKKNHNEKQVNQHNADYKPMADWEYLGMSKEQWDKYIWNRIDRTR